MGTLLFILSFLFVFGLLVFVHELGHFLAAKRSKVEVLEFGFGFPPAIFKKKIGETVYSINAIPLGGFVRMLGEDGGEAQNPKSFAAKPKLIKAKIIVAGVLMNFVLAWAIFSLLYAIGFSSLIPGTENHLGVAQHIYIEDIQKDTPAFNKGVQKGDELLTIDGKKVTDVDFFRQETKNKIGQEVKVEIKRGSEIKSLSLVPFSENISGQEVGRIGIAVSELVKANNILFSPIAGLSESFRLAKLTVLGIFGFFAKIITTFTLGEEVVGPVGIAVLTNQVRQLGFTFLLQFIAILSISLALLNILPVPGLDGGHLLVTFVEKLRGRDINNSLKNTLTMIGLILLIILVVIVTTKDLNRFGIIESIKKAFGF